jgi:hypothetical protein
MNENPKEMNEAKEADDSLLDELDDDAEELKYYADEHEQ